jgi:hypothetical protein
MSHIENVQSGSRVSTVALFGVALALVAAILVVASAFGASSTTEGIWMQGWPAYPHSLLWTFLRLF